MTAQQFADNALLHSASARAQALGQFLGRVPLNVWRTALIVLALFWLVHSLGRLFWVVYPTPTLPQPTTLAQPVANSASGSGVSVDLNLLQAINMGGEGEAESEQSDVAQEETVEVVGDVVETSLKLKLQGIIATSDTTKGKAVIADGNKQALYQVGESLPQGRNVKLARVLPDKVILDNNGRFESLPLYSEDDFKGTSSSRSSSRSNFAAPQRRGAGTGLSKAPDQPVDDAGSDSDPNSDKAVKRTINPADLKAKSINDVVRFSLHQENGQVMGFRIRPGRDRSLFDQMGLKANDVVTSVNGITVTDRNQLREIYKNMRSATEAQLEVNRDGEIIPITVSLDTGGQ